MSDRRQRLADEMMMTEAIESVRLSDRPDVEAVIALAVDALNATARGENMNETEYALFDAIRALDAEIERLTPTEEECKAMSMGYQALLGMDDYIAGDHDRILAAYLQRVRGTPDVGTSGPATQG